jgi:ribosomal protein S18 acetylase RimI-like enzyme
MKKYLYQLCDETDTEIISQIMEDVNKEINTSTIFVKDSKDFIEDHIDKKGFIIKAIYNNKIIGFLIVRVPKLAEDNLGREVDMSQDELKKVAHIESVAVVPKHRGKRLQHKMIQYAESIIKKRGLHTAMATVSPKNKYSLINFLKHDYQVIKMKKKYGGVTRLILIKRYRK